MDIHEVSIGPLRLYALATKLTGRLTAGVALTKGGEVLWRVDDLALPADATTSRAALEYAVSVGHDVAHRFTA